MTMKFQSKAMQRRAQRWPLHLGYLADDGVFVTRSSKDRDKLDDHLDHDAGLFPHRAYGIYSTQDLLELGKGVDAY